MDISLIQAPVASYHASFFAGKPEPVRGSGNRHLLYPGATALVSFNNPDIARWHDVIPIDGEGVFLFKQSAVEQMQSIGVSGIEFHPVVIERILSSKLNKVPRPTYYWGRITGTLDGTLFLNGNPVPVDPKTGVITKETSIELRMSLPAPGSLTFKPNWESWSGCDFFYLWPYPTRKNYCGERVSKLAAENRWTNIFLGSTVMPDGLMKA